MPNALHLCPLLPCVALLAAAGCAPSRETGTVWGKVNALNRRTGEMQPVVTGQVQFHHPEHTRPVAADIQPDGTYQAEGVPVGPNTVTVESPELTPEEMVPAVKGTGPDPSKWFPLPARYSAIDTTPFTLQVKKGSQPFDLVLR